VTPRREGAAHYARRPHRARRPFASQCATSHPRCGALGAEQSGHVAAVGFELYVELLNEAVAELQGQKRIAARPVRVDARVDAYVPATYVDSEALRIDVHRRLALAETEDELRELQAALEDRYGPLPEPVENLFRIQEAKIKVALLGADYLVFQSGKATVGRLVLGSGELRELRDRAKTAVYVSSKQEVSIRGQEEIAQAVDLISYLGRTPGGLRPPPHRASRDIDLTEEDSPALLLLSAVQLHAWSPRGGGARSIPADAIAQSVDPDHGTDFPADEVACARYKAQGQASRRSAPRPTLAPRLAVTFLVQQRSGEGRRSSA
jgi:hypothetical protein